MGHSVSHMDVLKSMQHCLTVIGYSPILCLCPTNSIVLCAVDLENNNLFGGPVILQARKNKQPIRHGKHDLHYFTRNSDMATNRNFDVAGFHNFTMVWTSNGVSSYIDGKQYGIAMNNGEYAEPYHIVLSVGAGGNLEFEDAISKPWRNGDIAAFALFHRSFQGCCARQSYRKSCVENKKERTCSREWGPRATMVVKSVRVYAI
ncbi:uncharacterized protein LOC128921828 [Zeugodacus cucurbitae]|uniref:uncharacterized protein LOC128921828 n=1 Tax=Zeugodacus cucurbitae TaxID=28588 RepID=UPI0023D95356|nr:uncharacterized protein LOC128921828 [Zeugodacus cucurbitae]